MLDSRERRGSHPKGSMNSPADREDFDSTLVRSGAQATTFTEMIRFVSDIESRPIEKLIFDLPELARLSNVKFALARQLLRRRLAALPEQERANVREIAESVAATIGAADSERMLSVFAAPGEA